MYWQKIAKNDLLILFGLLNFFSELLTNSNTADAFVFLISINLDLFS